MQLNATLETFIYDVQEPADVIEESPPIAGTGRGGTQTLRVALVVEKGVAKRQRLHRVYYGIQDGDHFTFLLFTAGDEDTFRKHLPTFDAVAASWNPRGQFPEIEFELTAPASRGEVQ